MLTRRIIGTALLGGVCLLATSVSPASAVGFGYGPGQPTPGGGAPGFGRIIEARTIAASGGHINVAVPQCFASIVVPAATFPKPVELVITGVNGSNRDFDFGRYRYSRSGSRNPKLLCGIGVTIYGQRTIVHSPFAKPLSVSFSSSSINSDTQILQVTGSHSTTPLGTTVSGHTATALITSDADLEVVGYGSTHQRSHH